MKKEGKDTSRIFLLSLAAVTAVGFKYVPVAIVLTGDLAHFWVISLFHQSLEQVILVQIVIMALLLLILMAYQLFFNQIKEYVIYPFRLRLKSLSGKNLLIAQKNTI